MPAVIGMALLVTMRSREPLVKTLFYNDTVMDVPRIEAALRARGTEEGFTALLWRSFLLKSPGGTPEFNAELAKMHWLSVPIIMVPVMAMMMVALWRLIRGMKALTGLTTDEIFKTEPVKKPAA